VHSTITVCLTCRPGVEANKKKTPPTWSSLILSKRIVFNMHAVCSIEGSRVSVRLMALRVAGKQVPKAAHIFRARHGYHIVNSSTRHANLSRKPTLKSKRLRRRSPTFWLPMTLQDRSETTIDHRSSTSDTDHFLRPVQWVL